jgi:hypothetical protein
VPRVISLKGNSPRLNKPTALPDPVAHLGDGGAAAKKLCHCYPGFSRRHSRAVPKDPYPKLDLHVLLAIEVVCEIFHLSLLFVNQPNHQLDCIVNLSALVVNTVFTSFLLFAVAFPGRLGILALPIVPVQHEPAVILNLLADGTVLFFCDLGDLIV